MAATIVQSGSYDLTIATGFLVDAFTLDDSIKGVLDSPDYVLDGSTEFASVIDGATGISVFRGRRDIGDQFTAGTMSFDLNDTFTGGIFNPFDTQSPYYDTDQAVPGLAPMRKVLLSREGEPLGRCRHPHLQDFLLPICYYLPTSYKQQHYHLFQLQFQNRLKLHLLY